MKKQKNKQPQIVVIGGGTGTFTVLQGLKQYPVDLSAIVTMMDSGGSSGKLRDELGVLPPGDVRQCLVALATSSQLMRDLFSYRFTQSDMKGHTFGNIFISAMEKTTGSMEKAIEEIGKILSIHGQVIPVTFKKTELCVELEDGKTIVGETHIDEVEVQIKRAKITRAYLSDLIPPNPKAVDAILHADLILIGPGDLYTSIVPNLLVPRIAAAIKKSQAKKIYVLNLMTKYGQTTQYTAINHVVDLEKYLGEKTLDAILINNTKPKKKTLAWYEDFGEEPVLDNLTEKMPYQLVRKDLLRDIIIEKQSSDTLKRSIIRHDSKKLAKAVMELLQ
jgi:uncharacterized cofD-like protein